MTPEEVKKLTVKKLQEELDKRNLDKKGNKAELVERLLEHFKEEEKNDEDAAPERENDAKTEENGENEASPSNIDQETESAAAAEGKQEEEGKEVSSESVQEEEKAKGSDGQPQVEEVTSKQDKRPASSLPDAPASAPAKKHKSAESKTIPPSKISPTCTVRIDNFIRPFTLNAVKEFVQEDGPFVEDGFWMDAIKTHCYVTYESVDVAQRVRERVYNKVWPELSGRQLKVEYSTKTASEIAKAQAEIKPTRNAPTKTAKPVQATPRPKVTAPKPPVTINDLFCKTQTKPVLFYLPVPADVAETRLKDLAAKKQSGHEGRRHGRSRRAQKA